jgi:hypothetical protein
MVQKFAIGKVHSAFHNKHSHRGFMQQPIRFGYLVVENNTFLCGKIFPL